MGRSTLRACSTPGCGALVPAGDGKCGPCRQAVDQARGTPAERGYDARHRRIRAQWAPLVAAGGVICWRCNLVIPPGAPWQMGHDDDKTGYVGPEHQSCGSADGGRKGLARRSR
jgi:hypothetical protein